jgi:hypothetical protein
MSRRGKWVGFRIRRDDGSFSAIELNDRGQLLEPPPRLPRRRNPYSEETHLQSPSPRVSRLAGTPSVAFGEIKEDNEMFNRSQEANPGPYTGSLDEEFSNDSFSFGYEDEYGTFDPFVFAF